MKLIDHTPYLTETGEISLLHKIIGTFRFGDFWVDEVKAQKIVIDALERDLVPGYTLLRNIQLPGVKVNLPMVLVGPGGMYLLAVTTLKGTYHAIEGSWQVESRSKIKPVRPNLLRDTSMMAQAVEKHLKDSGLEPGPVEPVLIASELSMYIHKDNPIIRIVMRDTIDLLAESINKAEPILSINMINRIVDFLSLALPGQAPVDEWSSLQAGMEDPLPAADPAQDLNTDLPRVEDDKPFEFGGESTPWDLMEDFSFDTGEEEEKPPEVFKYLPPTPKAGEQKTVSLKPTPKKRSTGSRFTLIQWIILALGSLAVIMLILFIMRTLASIQ